MKETLSSNKSPITSRQAVRRYRYIARCSKPNDVAATFFQTDVMGANRSPSSECEDDSCGP